MFDRELSVMPRVDEIAGVVFRSLEFFSDQRGWLTELYREDRLPAESHPVMAYVGETRPGVVRGPHEHVDQTDLFAFLGPADFRLHLWDARPDSTTHGCRLTAVVGASNPQVVLIPPGVVHAYQNISEFPGVVLNFPNRLYRGEGSRGAVDEIRHEDDPQTPYRLP